MFISSALTIDGVPLLLPRKYCLQAFPNSRSEKMLLLVEMLNLYHLSRVFKA